MFPDPGNNILDIETVTVSQVLNVKEKHSSARYQSFDLCFLSLPSSPSPAGGQCQSRTWCRRVLHSSPPHRAHCLGVRCLISRLSPVCARPWMFPTLHTSHLRVLCLDPRPTLTLTLWLSLHMWATKHCPSLSHLLQMTHSVQRTSLLPRHSLMTRRSGSSRDTSISLILM